MNWVFLDCIPWDYDVTSPGTRPLGGSQSALCYLALALAQRGERVTTLTNTSKPREISGVRCLRYEAVPRDVFLPDDTVIVVLNGPAEIARAVRGAVPPGKQLVLWTQHAHDQPAAAALRDPACRELWDHVVCVSEWQKEMYHQALGVPRETIEIQRNAVAPAFQNLFASADELADVKAGRVRLAYTSTPFRGLDVLLACFPAIYKRHPFCQLDVYSSMQVYDEPAAVDPYNMLYDQCRATPGVNYRGSLPQPWLARELAATSLLAYPNTYAETSCIAAMEALAAGLQVVTSDLAALPETCGGHARLVPPAGGERTQEQFAIDFARALDQTLTELASDGPRWARERFEQSQAINAACNYDVRAAEWLAAGQRWLKRTKKE